ncbi:MAG: hypothetical protein ACRDTV_25565, partial [Mycobacterium sp.]
MGIGIFGIFDIFGIGDMDGMLGMFCIGIFLPFMSAFMASQQSFAWLAVVAGPFASQQSLCEPGCAMRRYRPA